MTVLITMMYLIDLIIQNVIRGGLMGQPLTLNELN